MRQVSKKFNPGQRAQMVVAQEKLLDVNKLLLLWNRKRHDVQFRNLLLIQRKLVGGFLLFKRFLPLDSLGKL